MDPKDFITPRRMPLKLNRNPRYLHTVYTERRISDIQWKTCVSVVKKKSFYYCKNTVYQLQGYLLKEILDNQFYKYFYNDVKNIIYDYMFLYTETDNKKIEQSYYSYCVTCLCLTSNNFLTRQRYPSCKWCIESLFNTDHKYLQKSIGRSGNTYTVMDKNELNVLLPVQRTPVVFNCYVCSNFLVSVGIPEISNKAYCFPYHDENLACRILFTCPECSRPMFGTSRLGYVDDYFVVCSSIYGWTCWCEWSNVGDILETICSERFPFGPNSLFYFVYMNLLS